MKVALVHDYLSEAGGAERVLKVLSEMFPDAPIYTAFVKQGSAREMLGDRSEKIVESSWGWLLKLGRMYSYLRFCLPWIWRSIDLSEYDLIITSCSGYIARGFRVSSDAKVVAYCHTPPRWLYGYETPTGAAQKWWGKLFMVVVGPWVRYFDFTSSQRVDTWIANSKEVAKRISKFYRKKAIVVYPPVDLMYPSNPVIQYSSGGQENRKTGRQEHDYYLTVARVTGAKGLVETAAVFGAMKKKLIIVGELVGGNKIRTQIEQAGKGYVELVGRVSDTELTQVYSQARAFVAMASNEDFGMTVVESMQCGTPVLALNSGGYRESVKQGVTGVIIEGIGQMRDGILQIDKIKWDREKIKKWGETFGRSRFEKEIHEILNY